jgi:pimeloyl-ACP methyl ester carboxylesterase
MTWIDVNDTRLFVTDEGDGQPALLFVHGYTADSHDWSWQLPHFAANHRVIAVDLRGHGRSGAPATGYTTQQFAADLAAVLEQLDVAQVVAFGHSMGGSVVSALAVESPALVRGVIAVDPAYLLPDEVAVGIEPVLVALEQSDPVPLVQSLVGGLDTPTTDPALRTWHLRRIAGVEPHVLRQTLAAQVTGMALHSHSEPYLRRRTCPVLTFYTDPTRAPVEQAVFADARSRVVTWESAGHWLHQERPDEFNRIVSDWLAALG